MIGGVSIVLAAAIAAAAPLEADLRAVAALAGEPAIVSAAGVMRDESPVVTLENRAAFDPDDRRLRVVLVGAPSGDPDAVLDLVRWFKTRAPRPIRQRWALSALPLASFDNADTQSLDRWLTFQAPDLIVTVGGLSVAALAPVASIAAANATAAFATLLEAPRGQSPLRTAIVARVVREPLAIARVLARRYPEAPSISYIPALAWVQTLALADLVKDDSLRDKVAAQTRPWTSGEKPLFGDRVLLTSVAGGMVFDELKATTLFDEAAAAAAKEKASGEPEYGQGWTDDMFMAASVLARSGAKPGRAADLDKAARLLTTYAARLQQPSGLFNHAVNGPAAWGRGNGFAALGLVETLERMPEAHPARARLLEIYRRQMAGVSTVQAPDGAFRQILDEAGAYREETATAMLLAAMAHGIGRGWLDASYRPIVDRAWRALAAHVADDGTVIDVCSGTGAGPTRRYYFDRPAVTGADDRGGAMALLAAMEVGKLRIWK